MPTERNEEESYFKALEIEQRRKLREKLEASAKELAEQQSIAASIKTEDLDLATRIKALGFSGETANVFDLMPLIHVAWADGSVERSERATILRVLRARGIQPGSEGFMLVESLLEERPSEDYMNQSLSVLRDLLANSEVERSSEIVDLCQRVATASGGFLGLGAKVNPAERTLIEQISRQLGQGAQHVRSSLHADRDP